LKGFSNKGFFYI